MLRMRVMWFQLLFLVILGVFQASADSHHCQVSDLPSCSINPNQGSCSLKPGNSRSTRDVKDQDYYHNLKNSRSERGTEDQNDQHDAVNSRFVRAADYHKYHNPRTVRSVQYVKHQDHHGSSHFRSARAVNSQEYHHNPASSRRARAVNQDIYEEPRYTRFGVALEQQEHNQDIPSQQQGYSRPLYSEYDGTLGQRESLLEEEAGTGKNKEIPATPFYTHARYCPHCRKMLPPEPMIPQQPMDPRLFQQLQQRNLQNLRFFNHHHSNINPNLRSGTAMLTEEMCPYTNGMTHEQPDTHYDVHPSTAYESYNQTAFQMPNSVLEFPRSGAASGNVTMMLMPPPMHTVSAGPKMKHMKQPVLNKEMTKTKETKRSI